MTHTVNKTRAAARRWPLWVLAVPAAVSIWAGWVGLGSMCGFGVVQLLPGIADRVKLNTAITLPIGMEAYSAYALGAWLSTRPLSRKARAYAKWSALTALGLGLVGQIVYHLLTTWGYAKAPFGVVVFVACLPVFVLGGGAALHHLLDNTEHTDEQPLANPHQALTEVEYEPVPAADTPALTGSAPASIQSPPVPAIEAPTREPVPVSAARRPAKRASRKGRRPQPRRLRADYLVEAREKFAAAEAGTDPSPSWCKRVTGCSDGTSVFLARSLRADLANTTGEPNQDLVTNTPAARLVNPPERHFENEQEYAA